MQARKPRPSRTLKQRAIALLARREYSRDELRARLVRRSPGAEAESDGAPDVESVLDELAGAGYLSDARFASAVVRQKRGGYSRRAIAYELKEKRVESGAASAALAELDGVDERAAAQALWQRRFGHAPKDERDKARQMRFLLSRGYAHAIVFDIMRRASLDTEPEAE